MDENLFLKSTSEDYDAYLDLALSTENEEVLKAMAIASEKTPRQN